MIKNSLVSSWQLKKMKKKLQWYYKRQENWFHLIVLCFLEMLVIYLYEMLIELVIFLIYI